MRRDEVVVPLDVRKLLYLGKTKSLSLYIPERSFPRILVIRFTRNSSLVVCILFSDVNSEPVATYFW